MNKIVLAYEVKEDESTHLLAAYVGEPTDNDLIGFAVGKTIAFEETELRGEAHESDKRQAKANADTLKKKQAECKDHIRLLHESNEKLVTAELELQTLQTN